MQFLYETESPFEDTDILKDIQKGVKLKHVRTNDRSKPFLRGNKAVNYYFNLLTFLFKTLAF